MQLSVIKTEEQYESYLDWVDGQLSKNLNPESKEGKKLEVALLIVKHYEDEYYPVPAEIQES